MAGLCPAIQFSRKPYPVQLATLRLSVLLCELIVPQALWNVINAQQGTFPHLPRYLCGSCFAEGKITGGAS
jgi:hypothetical protein